MTWLSALRRFCPALIVLAFGVWVARLDHLRGVYLARAIMAEAGREVDQAHGERDVARTEARNAERQISAANAYAVRIASREPLILHSTNTVREYATTDAGRVRCRAAERVRAIDALDTDIAEAAGAASGSTAGVHADPSAPAG